MGGCGCGGTKTLLDYEVTFRHNGEKQLVTHEEGGLIKVRQLLAKAPWGGTHKPIPRPK
ncbi:hypothetical protein [Streptomyces wedmorensis]